MTRPFRSAASVLLLLALSACGPEEPAAEPADLVITDVTVVDAENGARAGQTVVVDDGRITSVAPSGDGAVEAVEVVDGSGRYLIPGLWDFHVHLSYDERFTDAMPALFLRHGITSIRDTGGWVENVRPVVERMEAEGATAPRVFWAGPLLDGEFVVYDGENRPPLGIANPDPETARENVARLAEAGVDFLKVYEMVTPEVFDAIVSAAEERGLPVDGHVPLSMTADEAGPRMTSMEHLRNVELACAAGSDELLAARRSILANTDGMPGADLRSRLHGEQRLPAVAAYDEARCDEVLAALENTIQVPTLRLNALGIQAPWQRDDWEEALARLPAEAEEAWRAETMGEGGAPARDTTFGAWSLFLVEEMHQAGVPLGAGTDTPIGYALPGYSLHSELAMLVRAGLTPREALRAATVRPAEFFGLQAEMGTVETGMLADLVLLSANPLEDIEATRGVEAVVTRGELLTLEELDALLP